MYMYVCMYLYIYIEREQDEARHALFLLDGPVLVCPGGHTRKPQALSLVLSNKNKARGGKHNSNSLEPEIRPSRVFFVLLFFHRWALPTSSTACLFRSLCHRPSDEIEERR